MTGFKSELLLLLLDVSAAEGLGAGDNWRGDGEVKPKVKQGVWVRIKTGFY